MTLDAIVNIPGNLKDAYKAAVPGTLRHVDKLTNERRTNPVTPEGENLRNQWFYTADGELYFVEGKSAKLAMTREDDNLVLRHIDDAFAQLTAGGNYIPDRAEADAAIKASTTEVFDLGQLKLKKHDNEFSYMEVSTTKYKKLNPEQRRLAERVYGKGDNFVANMKILHVEGNIETTRVWVLNPDYVKKNAQGSPIARASWLGNFDGLSNFGAYGRYFGISDRVRGVRQVVAAGDAPQTEGVPSTPVAPQEIRAPTMDEVLAVSRIYVADAIRPQFEAEIGKLYKP